VLFRSADKLQMRDWMSARAPELKLAELRFVGAGPRDIPDDALAGGVMVKWNASSGHNVQLPVPPADREAVNRRFETWAQTPFGANMAEWSYACVERRIMVEQLLPNGLDDRLLDFNVYCCDGIPLFFRLIEGDGFPPASVAIYEADGARRPIEALLPDMPKGRVWAEQGRALPACWQRVVEVARTLSQDFDFVRVDLMQAGGELYAGEMSIFIGGAFGLASVPGIADDLRDRWDVRKSWFMTAPQRGWRATYARALRRVLDATN
jgi:hypothetical protein